MQLRKEKGKRMSQSDQFDNHQDGNDGNNAISDTYNTETSADIYNTPDVSADPSEDAQTEEIIEEDASSDVVTASVDSTPYSGQPGQYSNPYTDNTYENPYGNSPYGNK